MRSSKFRNRRAIRQASLAVVVQVLQDFVGEPDYAAAGARRMPTAWRQWERKFQMTHDNDGGRAHVRTQQQAAVVDLDDPPVQPER